MIERTDAKNDLPLNAAGIILAGGKSSRFGRDKALEPIDGKPLIQRIKEEFGTLFQEVIVVANQPEKYEFLGVEIHRDIIPGLGPIGGLYTGLTVIGCEWSFFAACDMPFINKRLVRALADLRPGYDVVAPRVDWKIEPLHAFYNRRCLAPLQEIIESGQRQIIPLFKQVRVRFVEEEELRAIDPELTSFFNINFPEDALTGFSGKPIEYIQKKRNDP
jgi:molybdenum cofactor guanylyltransferase